MKPYFISLVAAALLISGGLASAQQTQYDSLGSPTPAPKQGVSPNATTPNVPNTGVGVDKTTGSGAANGGVNGPVNTGTSTPTVSSPTNSNTGVATPSGLTND